MDARCEAIAARASSETRTPRDLQRLLGVDGRRPHGLEVQTSLEPKWWKSVSVTVKNTGKEAGATVAQVYAGQAASLPKSVQQTKRTLVQSGQVSLAPGESRRLTMTVAARQLSSWDTRAQKWILGSRNRTFLVGTSVYSTPLQKTVKVS